MRGPRQTAVSPAGPLGTCREVKVEASADDVTACGVLVVSASAEAEHGGEVGGDGHRERRR